MSEKTGALKLVEIALERARYEYTELSENWKLIDTKAHATATVSGVFVAAVFAFSQNSQRPSIETHVKVLILLLITTLAAAVFSSVMCMLARQCKMPPSGKSTREDVNIIVSQDKNEDELTKDYEAILRRFLNEWIEANDDLERCTNSKANWLSGAQIALIASAVLGCVLAAIGVLSNVGHP